MKWKHFKDDWIEIQKHTNHRLLSKYHFHPNKWENKLVRFICNFRVLFGLSTHMCDRTSQKKFKSKKTEHKYRNSGTKKELNRKCGLFQLCLSHQGHQLIKVVSLKDAFIHFKASLCSCIKWSSSYTSVSARKKKMVKLNLFYFWIHSTIHMWKIYMEP